MNRLLHVFVIIVLLCFSNGLKRHNAFRGRNFRLAMNENRQPYIATDISRLAAVVGATLLIATPSSMNVQPVFAQTLAEQLAQMQVAQNALDAQDIEWTDVKGFPGVSFRNYREGKGNSPVVAPGNEVTCEMVVRIKKLATQNEPGGIRYYSTKLDTPDNQFTFVVGDGSLPPSLEAGLAGMSKNSLRRVELPSTLVFQARDNKQLPIPSEKDEDGTRRYKKLFKTDATLIFEVLVTKVVEPTQ